MFMTIYELYALRFTDSRIVLIFPSADSDRARVSWVDGLLIAAFESGDKKMLLKHAQAVSVA
jgi:hypothetical protein